MEKNISFQYIIIDIFNWAQIVEWTLTQTVVKINCIEINTVIILKDYQNWSNVHSFYDKWMNVLINIHCILFICGVAMAMTSIKTNH